MGEVIRFPNISLKRSGTPDSICLGYDPDNKPIWAKRDSDITLEKHILASLNKDCLMELMARLFGSKIFVGEYRSFPNPDSANKYFLFWCAVHQTYYVSRLYGEREVGICQDCQSEKSNEVPIVMKKTKKSADILKFTKRQS